MLFDLILARRVSLMNLLFSLSVASSSGIRRNFANDGSGSDKEETQSG